jgi:hypothetical protein
MALVAPTPDSPRRVTVSLDETLRQLKAELRREFPTTRFSIRRSRGTGYGWVSVRWTDGPKYREVEAITAGYCGGGFDGMTDSSYSIDHLSADAEGNPILLRHATRGINCSREHSTGEIARVARLLLEKCGDESLDAEERIRLRGLDELTLVREAGRVRLWDDYLSTHCYRALEDTTNRYAFLNPSPDA